MVDEEEGDMKNDPHIPGWRIKLVMEKRNTRRKLAQTEVECELPWRYLEGIISLDVQLHTCVCMCVHVCTRVHSLQSCPILCDPMDCSPPGSSVHGILQARKLEWVAMPFSRGSSQSRNRTRVSCVSCTAG